MFRHPENEYDWLSSDAAVDEALLINEYTFTGIQKSRIIATTGPFLTNFL